MDMTLQQVVQELRQVEQLITIFESEPHTHSTAKRAIDAQKKVMRIRPHVGYGGKLHDRWLRAANGVLKHGFDVDPDGLLPQKPAKKASDEIKPIFVDLENPPLKPDWAKKYHLKYLPSKPPVKKSTAKMYKGTDVFMEWFDEAIQPPKSDDLPF
jgi:hypothetical protein